MAEVVLDLFHVAACLDQESGTGVPQVVYPEICWRGIRPVSHGIMPERPAFLRPRQWRRAVQADERCAAFLTVFDGEQHVVRSLPAGRCADWS